MSAETLRKAAKILRGRAIGADDGYRPGDEDPWFVVPDTNSIRTKWVTFAEAYEAEAPYIATMHPGVGLALAEWLDCMAAVWDGGGKYVMGSTEQKALAAMDEYEPHPTSLGGRAFALARLILSGAK